MRPFDTVMMVDWSARSTPSPARPTKDAIFIGIAQGADLTVHYKRTRHAAMAFLTERIDALRAAGRRVLVGFDFPFGYPRGFARAVTGRDDPFAVWEWLAAAITDDEKNGNNRWEVALRLNAMFPGVGPFWGCPATVASTDLPAKGRLREGHGMKERRAVERLLPRAQPCWKLFTTGSVGSQVLMGLPHLQRLRERYGADLSVSPFEAGETPIVLAEIYPGLLDAAIKAQVRKGEILDAVQVRLVAKAFAGVAADDLAAMLQEGDAEEGWILGLGHEAALLDAMVR
ncbi:molybdopterin guanine dinucleotide synthesis [Gymnodinialimonas ceratoperidinii]|uniref:Molybdopterin guanine dinucleotide synthesis n=1 Tax=Gymnodinialimonas ceratoperidinii TaxID=2856823 RepID=A0A8F6TW30_9RHOB|nr:molybdopterin guanine dinucleotide synthesis [Gymnodinialimonas ceratoperidinii]QXT39765.1 molybdopterin guanine dinucleotide synthesis [Gymnodinialimonas ceratoperidinii]